MWVTIVSSFAGVILFIILALIAFKIYNKLSAGVYKGNERLDGKTVIVTGASAGIGAESAKDFAGRGARVLMLCRDLTKGERVRQGIINSTGNNNIILKRADFSSLNSVRSCANEILAEESRIDVLLNNAGAAGLGLHNITVDGLEVLMQTNHFAPFLFTNILLGKIKENPPARIVNVSSVLHKWAKLDLNDLNQEKTKTENDLYANTKLANNYFTITLANKLGETGIGVECAKDFAGRGARVLMICRDLSKGEKVRQDIINATGNANIVLKRADFSSLASVRSCANEILAEEPRIDILLNNAGALGLGLLTKTADGLDVLMQTNHFAPFLFTNILLGKIKENPPARIVNLSSTLHKWAKFDINDLNQEKTKTENDAYGNTKLVTNLFTIHLANMLKETGVTVNCLHPGVVKTDIFRSTGSVFTRTWVSLSGMFFKDVWEGAQTSIFLCVSPSVEKVTGKYFADCKEVRPSREALDYTIASKLWELSEEAVQLRNSEKHY